MLGRQRSRWFVYRHPSPSTIEIYTANLTWETLDAGNEPFLYSYFDAQKAAKYWNCQYAEESTLETMRETVSKLAAWRKAHETKA